MRDRRELINDPEESLRMAMEGHQAQMWTALPAVVVSYNATSQTVSVQPTIQGATTAKDGSTSNVNLPMLVDVPVCWPRGGGFACTFPVVAGDECLVVFASRCIDGWWQSGGVQKPAEDRMHDLSDGFAIFAPTSQPRKLTNVQTDGIELRNDARDTFLKLTDGVMQIEAASVIINGDVTHTGNQTTSGTITGTTDVVGASVSLKNHGHYDVSNTFILTGKPRP